ncbi:EamA family transporter [Bacillus pseudomycoides]|uniref:EamA family transporter n=1 Tax=Bacillus pseudomycoides TaxID=64104 RepID=A0AA91ZUV2_9BACI|nr:MULTISPECIES: DMT family transporter [Bacillus]PEB52237.1 EamA family transporter [Bacillus sp. AFS098217]PED84085.1 EamA family transporter [Bacillus pseudomycoides]PEU11655.1 EamA family transporter [Bacillus sp. AFS019443]PEU12841.1 EamA family transporter [Bacillus sp. AFS014408]PFW64736.1 EamA family transporter [Bacillus sp. AFS075034]
MQSHSNSNKIYFLMLLVPLFWGGSFSTAEHVVTEIPPLVAATLRFGIAGIILMIYLTIKSEWHIASLKKRWKGLLLVSLTGIFGYNALFFLGVNYTSAINGSLIIATMPIFVTLGAIIFLNERWNNKVGISLALSLIGVVIVITKGSLDMLLSLAFNIGDVLFIAALTCGVIYGLVGKSIMKDVSPLFATTIMTVIGAVFLAIASIFEGGWGSVPSMSVQGWLEMFYMVICGTLVGYIIFNKGVGQIGASKASIYLNLTPIVTTLISVLFYGSTMTWKQVIGMILVLLGVYIATAKTTKQSKSVSLNN